MMEVHLLGDPVVGSNKQLPKRELNQKGKKMLKSPLSLASQEPTIHIVMGPLHSVRFPNSIWIGTSMGGLALGKSD